VLAHELVGLGRGQVRRNRSLKGGLAAWQEREALTYIEERLAEQITWRFLLSLLD
jgi:hypothetical protein